MVDNQGLSSTTDPMTSTSSEAENPSPPSAAPPEQPTRAERTRAVMPVLEKLFELYPHLFGVDFLPLKLGIFQELMTRHPDLFKRDELKAALGFHARSTRYLQCVAAGKPRHDLDGQAVQDVAPEHVYQALLELHRRRQLRTKEDLQPKLRAQLMAAFDASGLTRADYLTLVQTTDAQANALLEEALDEHEQKVAKQTALLKALDASGKTVDEFADMYGMDKREVSAAVARRKRQQNPSA